MSPLQAHEMREKTARCCHTLLQTLDRVSPPSEPTFQMPPHLGRAGPWRPG